MYFNLPNGHSNYMLHMNTINALKLNPNASICQILSIIIKITANYIKNEPSPPIFTVLHMHTEHGTVTVAVHCHSRTSHLVYILCRPFFPSINKYDPVTSNSTPSSSIK